MTQNNWFAVNRVDGQVFASIVGEVGIGNQTAEEFISAVGDAEQIFLTLDSTGGCGSIAFALYEFLAQRQTTTTITGNAFSAAAVLFLAGKHRRIARNGSLLIHPVRMFLYGTAQELLDGAVLLERYDAIIAAMVQHATRCFPDHCAKLLRGGDWCFNAEQALKARLATEIFTLPAPAPTITTVAASSSTAETEDQKLCVDFLRAMGPIGVRDKERFTHTIREWLCGSVREV